MFEAAAASAAAAAVTAPLPAAAAAAAAAVSAPPPPAAAFAAAAAVTAPPAAVFFDAAAAAVTAPPAVADAAAAVAAAVAAVWARYPGPGTYPESPTSQALSREGSKLVPVPEPSVPHRVDGGFCGMLAGGGRRGGDQGDGLGIRRDRAYLELVCSSIGRCGMQYWEI